MADEKIKPGLGAILADAVNYNSAIEALEEGVALTEEQKGRLREIAARLGKPVPDEINCIENADSAWLSDTEFGFIPQKLIIVDRPELSVFPLNVLFADFKRESGKVFGKQALYKPNLNSYSDDGSKQILQYYNQCQFGSNVLITYERHEKTWYGKKIVKGNEIGMAYGKNWKTFFFHFTMLGLAKGEGCMLEIDA